MNPFDAKRAIRDKKKYPWRADWTKEMSIEVMTQILKFKFAKHTSWGKKLMATGKTEIVEWNNWNDTFWGKDVVTKEGENHLGKILMSIRDSYDS